MPSTKKLPGQIKLRSVWLVTALIAVLANTTFAQIGGVDLDTVKAGPLDNGKMWTFEYAPSAYFSDTYGFDANNAWFESARLPALRIPGCSASFVSPNGLMVTNHHCVRGAVARVSGNDENLLDDGFYASSLENERPIPRYYADQLIGIEDVSDEVLAALDRAVTDVAREEVRGEVYGAIQSRLRTQYASYGNSVWVQIIALYNGGRYSAYVFKRYSDIRLVFAVELQMGFFGGDPDNFTYPRYALDFAFLRAYDENGAPYQSEHHFGWGSEGVEEGDPIFVIGNPGPTNRLNTVAQLEYQRDVSVPAVVAFRSSRLNAMADYRSEFPEEAEARGIRNTMFGLSNSLKANTGRLEALSDPVILARRNDAERALIEEIASRPELNARYGEVIDRIAAIQVSKSQFAAQYAAFVSMGSSAYSSATMRRALLAHGYLNAPNITMPEIRDSLLRVADQPADLERRLLIERFADFERYFGSDHPITQVALNGQTPEAAAVQLLEASQFATLTRTAEAFADDALDSRDPALLIAEVVLPVLQDYQRGYFRLTAEERDLASDLGRARFEVYGQSVAPDATFSPRITDGIVSGYAYNGTLAPPYTTFYGLYDRYFGHSGAIDWALPERWRTPPEGLDLGTPLNFVSTADTYGGNSGSPAVTPELALVGLNFDRNINGLSRDFIYLPERGRNVMVDVRAIHAALDVVYNADRIVQELTTGQLVQGGGGQ